MSITLLLAGYAGGDYPNPTYEETCRGGKGQHAEVVRVVYDPAETDVSKDLYDRVQTNPINSQKLTSKFFLKKVLPYKHALQYIGDCL